VYSPKQDKTEIARQMAQIMGIAETDMTDAKLAAIQGLLGNVGKFMKLPINKLDEMRLTSFWAVKSQLRKKKVGFVVFLR
jgi:hypothetical protein